MIFLKDIEIEALWGDTELRWSNLDPRINIVVGQNGFGKTTMLHLIRALLLKDEKKLKQMGAKIRITTAETAEGPEAPHPVGTMCYEGRNVTHNPEYGGYASADSFCYVNTFDVPASRKSSLSQLGQSLDEVLYQRRPDVYSFSDYRLGMLRDLRLAMHKQARIEKFFDLINSLFHSTGKTIDIDDKNRVVFLKHGRTIEMERLSAGEKQLLLLLFTLFLMEDRSAVLLLDEPEISLHIEWQDRLVEMMLDLNPNCQFILTTHSPNIFADGWEDKLVFISDLLTPHAS